MELHSLLVAMAIAALFPAAVLYYANIFTPGRRLALLGHGAAFVGWLLLTLGLSIQIGSEGFPALSTSFQTLTAIASALLLLHLVQVLWRDMPAVGAAVVPMALAALFTATAIPRRSPTYQQTVLESQWMYLHVITIALSIVLLLLATCGAIMWLAQHRLLKAKKWSGAFRRLPPLELLDSTSYYLAAVGFAALTVGVITAVVWALTHPEQHQVQNLLTRGTAVVSWLLYASYLWAHGNVHWRGRRANYILVAGCIALVLTTSLHRWVLPGLFQGVDTPRASSHLTFDR